mgnify:CR=1 FL=1
MVVLQKPLNQLLISIHLLGLNCFFWPNIILSSEGSRGIEAEDKYNLIIESSTQSSDNNTGNFKASGGVKLSSPGRSIYAQSDSLEYVQTKKIIILKGKVRLIRKGLDRLESERVIYSLSDGQIFANSEPSDPVKMKIFLGVDRSDESIHKK